jgi:hypothetical protein
MSEYGSRSQSADVAQTVHRTRAGRTPQSMSSDYSGWAGLTVFGAVLLVLTGIFQAMQGLVALFKDDYYEVGSSGLVIDVSYTTWGVVHLLAGGVAVAAGVSLFAGRMWARVVGTLVAGVSAIVNVGFLAAYPMWSVVVIVLDVLIIMALTLHGRDLVDHM